MKEININIEGYNVNGICVGCLNYDRRMHYDSDIKICFELLGEIIISDGLDIQLCWECLAYVKNVLRFRDQILKSYEFLINYSKKNPFLYSPEEFEPNAVTKLNQYILSIEDWPPVIENVIEDDVKSEEEGTEEEGGDNYFFDMPKQDEVDEITEDDVYEDLPSPMAIIVTSDDKIQLSHLQETDELKKESLKDTNSDIEEKSDRIKKKTTNSSEIKDTGNAIPRQNRKLKNLPPDMVELYTMTEQEMWSVRKEDEMSEEFLKVKFKCDKCVIAFYTEKLKTDHLNGIHVQKGKSRHRCTICQAYFLTKDSVASHKALHLNAYKCTICGMLTTLKIRMMKHLSTHRAIEQHNCDTCGIQFSTISKLSYHRSVCRQEKPQCDCCGKVFANKMTLEHHLKLLPHNKEDKPKGKLFIPCKDCDKVFHSKKNYRAHVVIHDGVTFPCSICGKLFQWKHNLTRHMRNHREREAGSLHECRECGKRFASRDCYNNHMTMSKRHVPEDSYQHECSYCGKKFLTKLNLADHMDWDHLKIIKYQCKVCFKSFKTAHIMMVHVSKIHHGKYKEDEGEHLCEICGKSYKTVKRLKCHVSSVHTHRPAANSYRCNLCPATFTWPTGIHRHMKMMHDTNKKTKPTRVARPVKKKRKKSPTRDST